MSDHIVRLSSNSNIVRVSPDSDPRATSLGTVAPRKFVQLIDVNMIGVADRNLVIYMMRQQKHLFLFPVKII